MTSKNWAIRTIKDGTVRICGKTYAPSDLFLSYDGRLDGLRYAFGRYVQAGKYLPAVCLWGSEDHYKDENFDGPLPEEVDGSYPWLWWNEVAP